MAYALIPTDDMQQEPLIDFARFKTDARGISNGRLITLLQASVAKHRALQPERVQEQTTKWVACPPEGYCCKHLCLILTPILIGSVTTVVTYILSARAFKRDIPVIGFTSMSAILGLFVPSMVACLLQHEKAIDKGAKKYFTWSHTRKNEQLAEKTERVLQALLPFKSRKANMEKMAPYLGELELTSDVRQRLASELNVEQLLQLRGIVGTEFLTEAQRSILEFFDAIGWTEQPTVLCRMLQGFQPVMAQDFSFFEQAALRLTKDYPHESSIRNTLVTLGKEIGMLADEVDEATFSEWLLHRSQRRVSVEIEVNGEKIPLTLPASLLSAYPELQAKVQEGVLTINVASESDARTLTLLVESLDTQKARCDSVTALSLLRAAHLCRIEDYEEFCFDFIAKNQELFDDFQALDALLSDATFPKAAEKKRALINAKITKLLDREDYQGLETLWQLLQKKGYNREIAKIDELIASKIGEKPQDIALLEKCAGTEHIYALVEETFCRRVHFQLFRKLWEYGSDAIKHACCSFYQKEENRTQVALLWPNPREFPQELIRALIQETK